MTASVPQLLADISKLTAEKANLQRQLAAANGPRSGEIAELRAEIERLNRELTFERRKNTE